MSREIPFVGWLAVATALVIAPQALAGPADGDGEIIAKYNEDLGGVDVYQVDLNGNFTWDGTGGGDGVTFVAPGQGPGFPLVGDSGELCKTSESLVFCDRNQNGTWDGNAGGDLATNFAPGAGAGTILFADTNGNGVKEIIKYVPDLGGSDVFLVDANENNVWDGEGGGDDVQFVAPGSDPGTPFACDCDGNGTVELGKADESASLVFVDLNNNGAWDGNGGGDVASGFSVGAGVGTFVIADFDGTDGDDIAKYFDSLAGSDLYQIDGNANNVWDGVAGGDRVTFIAPGAGSGTPCAIDSDGDGTAELCKIVSGTTVFADLNGNDLWDGNAGGDLAAGFAVGAGSGTFVVREAPSSP